MPGDSDGNVLVKQAEEILAKAKTLNKQNATLEALILADQALETFLRLNCLRKGCTDQTVMAISKNKEKEFGNWGMTEYILWLSQKGVIGKKEKADFFTFHKWRNEAQHSGLAPSTTQVSSVIESIATYFEKQKRTLEDETEYPYLPPLDEQAISEENDVHPVFRANPFLIEDGFVLVRGEKRLFDDTLQRIDLLFTDKKGIHSFVEAKWGSFSATQAVDYLSSLQKSGKPFRLIWLVPSSFKVDVPTSVEVMTFQKDKIVEIIRIRRQARLVIDLILKLLSKPFTPPPSMMYQLEYQFPNIISACYFDAEVKTETRDVSIGLRKQSIGRYLDIILSLCHSSYATNLPELTVLLIEETLNAPYYIELRGGIGKVEMQGFYGHIHEKRSDSKYRLIAQTVESIKNLTRKFIEENGAFINNFYGRSPSKSDLLYRVLLNMPSECFELGDRIIIKRLLEFVIREFSLQQTTPLASIRHSLLNVDISNKAYSTRYEMDMARRLVEIAALKRILQCISGVQIVKVLIEEYFKDKKVISRIPCQHFRLERNEKYCRGYLEVKS
jgi:hypothetical protein